ncbi:UNVERIFIED_CONTAM: hypothetical protein HDU68_007084, partial [Siphonaria sp. JEL0065]
MSFNSVTNSNRWLAVVQLADGCMQAQEHFFIAAGEDHLQRVINGIKQRSFTILNPRMEKKIDSMWKYCGSAVADLNVFEQLYIRSSEKRMHLAVIGEFCEFIEKVLSKMAFEDRKDQEMLERRYEFMTKFWSKCDSAEKHPSADIIQQCQVLLLETLETTKSLVRDQDYANRCKKIGVALRQLADHTHTVQLHTFRTDSVAHEDPPTQLARLAKTPAGAHAILVDALSLCLLESTPPEESDMLERELKRLCERGAPSSNALSCYSGLQGEYPPTLLDSAIKTIGAKWPITDGATLQAFYRLDTSLVALASLDFLIGLTPHILQQRNWSKIADSLKSILVFGGEAILVGERRDAFVAILNSL